LLVTVLLTVVGLFLALKVESIYKLMINSWASQLVIVFLPVVAALYLSKSNSRNCWTGMALSTVVWIGYTVCRSWNSGMDFIALMNSDLLDSALTCGAVYGFAAGIAGFSVSYLIDRISDVRSAAAKG